MRDIFFSDKKIYPDKLDLRRFLAKKVSKKTSLITLCGIVSFSLIIFTFSVPTIFGEEGVPPNPTKLTVLTSQSHPKAGENWTVYFQTVGIANLTITPDSQATIDDLDFISLTCNGEERTPQILENDVIFYPDWFCDGTGRTIHLVNVAGTHTLKFQFGDEIAYAYNSPDTLTLRPNGAGDETSITSQLPDSTEHWDKVDEVTPDETVTRIYQDLGSYLRDLYNLPSHTTESGTINFITIYFRCFSASGNAKPSQKSGATVTDGTEVTLSMTWTTFSQTYTTNPATGVAYTWEDIDALQIGVSLKGVTGVYSAQCTQVYVEVDYTPIWQPRPSGVSPSGGGFMMF